MKLKQTLTLLTAAGMCLANIPLAPAIMPATALTASAEETPTSGSFGTNLKWKYDAEAKKLTISGPGWMSYTGPWEKFKNEIVTVVISDGVKDIGENAFKDCKSLTSITIPNSVTSIGLDAFLHTPWLQARQEENPLVVVNSILIDGTTCSGDVTIQDAVTCIGKGAFDHCASLTGITIPNTVTSIDERAFYYCTELTGITIPDSVTSIGDHAFDSCTGLSSITIPDNVTEIGYGAFHGCKNLTEISISDSVTSIDVGAFGETPWLRDRQAENPFVVVNDILIDGSACEGAVTVPQGVKIIGEKAFYIMELSENNTWSYNNKLTSVTLPDSVTEIRRWAFLCCKSLTDVKSGNSLKVIGHQAFSYCDVLTNVALPDGLTDIETSAFSNCTSLKEISIPDSVTSIGDGAFSGCTSLTEFTIPGSVTSMGRCLFANCDNLKSIIIENGVKRIGFSAFSDCYGLTEISIPNSVTCIDDLAFDNCTSLTKITIPEGVKTIGESAFSNCTCLTAITIPGSVTSMGKFPFLNCDKLTSITISDGVTSIGNRIFANCNGLTEITIPDSVKSIGSEAFRECTALSSVSLPNQLETVHEYTFYGCSGLTDITIPESVKEIGENAFESCTSLSSITIPQSVTSIDHFAFFGCDNLIIKGYTGSYAESYAKGHNIPFETLGEMPVNDWDEKQTISRNTAEAELVVRVGDIDACNDEDAVAEHGYDPFTAKSQYAHGYPWPKDETDPAGTDRIFVGSKWNGESTDGYSSNYANYKNGNDTENAYGDGALSFTMEYDASEIELKNVILQLCIDDFQADSWDSVFSVTLNGKDAPFIAELLNHTDQTGPTAYIVSAMIPDGFFADIASGKLTVVIDETTGIGDGYAIDFAKLLINYNDQIFTGSFSGKTEPGATVRLLGTSTTVTASSTGEFAFSAIPGINAVRASKAGFVENYDSGIVLSAGTEWKPEIRLEEGEGTPDIDFSKFAETGLTIKGECNGDGTVSVEDAQIVLLAYVQTMAGLDSGLTEQQIKAADINGDNTVSVEDAQLILLYYVSNTLSGQNVTWDELLGQ